MSIHKDFKGVFGAVAMEYEMEKADIDIVMEAYEEEIQPVDKLLSQYETLGTFEDCKEAMDKALDLIKNPLVPNYVTVAVSREKDPDFMSSMVMKFTKADYSHVLVIYGDKICHSVGSGVGTESLTEFMETHDLPIKVRVPLNVTVEYMKGYAKGLEGKEYSQSQYWGFIFPFMRKYLKNGREKTICSEEVALFLNNCCGYDFDNDTLDWVSPKEVITYVQEFEQNR